MKLPSLFIASILSISGLHAQEATDLRAYEDQLYLGNIFYGSQNPTSVTHTPLQSFGDFQINYNYQNGDLKLIDDAKNEQWWNGTIYGIKKFERVSFEGGITYNNGSLNERRWNNTLFIADQNPYIIADSIKSKFSTEKFSLHGAASYILNDKINIALRAKYDVGSSATQNDPRPEIKGMRFNLNPGVEYKLNYFTIGLSANIGWLSESATHTVVRTEVPHYIFIFQGLGNYEAKTAIGYLRKYNGFNYGANLQFAYDKNARFANFLELGYYSENEETTDGSGSIKYKGGRYDGYNITINERFEIRSANFIQNITLTAKMHNTDGTWYTQKEVTDNNGNLYWDVVNEAVEYKCKEYNANVAYRFDLMNGKIPSLTAKISAEIEQSDAKNTVYGVSQKYTAATAELYVAKRLDIKYTQLKLFIDGKYRNCLSSDIYLDDFPPVLQPMANKYTKPAFDALMAGSYCIQAGAEATFPIKVKNYQTWLRVSADYAYKGYTGNSPLLKDTNRNAVNCGVSILF